MIFTTSGIELTETEQLLARPLLPESVTYAEAWNLLAYLLRAADDELSLEVDWLERKASHDSQTAMAALEGPVLNGGYDSSTALIIMANVLENVVVAYYAPFEADPLA